MIVEQVESNISETIDLKIADNSAQQVVLNVAEEQKNTPKSSLMDCDQQTPQNLEQPKVEASPVAQEHEPMVVEQQIPEKVE